MITEQEMDTQSFHSRNQSVKPQTRCLCLEREVRGVQPKERWLHGETRGWEYYAVGMLQPTLNRESQDGRNHEERRKYEALERKLQTTSS